MAKETPMFFSSDVPSDDAEVGVYDPCYIYGSQTLILVNGAAWRIKKKVVADLTVTTFVIYDHSATSATYFAYPIRK